MDKRLVGKWYKEEMGETLNIFDESPLRIKMSFTSSEYYNFEPNCIYEKDDFLCFEINDEEYRMVYHIKYVDGNIEGYYTQFGKEIPVKYNLVSEKPEDEEYRCLFIEKYVPNTNIKRIDILKKYASYDRTQSVPPYSTEYVLGGEIPPILEKYKFSEYIAGEDKSSDDIVFKTLDFVCDHFGHNGNSDFPSERKIEDIVEYCENNDGKINCRGLAILLASILRLLGIKARHITCMPYENPSWECHVVVDCLLPSGKRIMLDPTWRLYLKDADGKYLSLEQLRVLLIKEQPFFINDGASYNGADFDKEYHRNYMIKNTFRFSRGTYYNNGSDDDDLCCIELVPANYPAKNFSDSAKKEFVYNDAEFWTM